jgi:FkbM family methyltransferase
MKIYKKIALKFPQLGKYKRIIMAIVDTIRNKNSYSQYGEDKFIIQFLNERGIKKGNYIDVGANHPTTISNTFGLYKNGFKGYIVEPNKELANLYKYFRKRDMVFQFGLSNEVGLFVMNISKTPVLSSFNNLDENLIWKKEYIPVLTLDEIDKSLCLNHIDFLSIDTEGLNYKVLLGATQTLNKTLLLCIEVDNEKDELEVIDLLCNNNKFSLINKIHCNLFFENKNLKNIL